MLFLGPPRPLRRPVNLHPHLFIGPIFASRLWHFPTTPHLSFSSLVSLPYVYKYVFLFVKYSPSDSSLPLTCFFSLLLNSLARPDCNHGLL